MPQVFCGTRDEIQVDGLRYEAGKEVNSQPLGLFMRTSVGVIGLTYRIGFWSTHILADLQRNCRVAILYFLAEEPIRNREQQDCCLIVEVHVPDGVDSQWVQQAAENAIGEELGKSLTLWSASEDEALQYLRPDPGVTRGLLDLASGVPSIAGSLINRLGRRGLEPVSENVQSRETLLEYGAREIVE